MANRSDPSDSGKFSIESFQGGLRRDIDPTKLEDNQYPLLVNMRSRYGTLKPIKKPIKIDEFPSGIKQGCYAQGSNVLVFANGRAYIKNYESTKSFHLISHFALSSDVDYIFAEAVPFSFSNFGRTATAGLDIDRNATFSSPSPACIVCQDGLNKPQLLFTNGGVRDAKTFAEWKLTDDSISREYVPIMRNMLYHDGILYGVSPDKKQIYRSVTGRALDFVVAVQENGDKLSDMIFTEEAERMAINVNNAEITALAKINMAPSHPDFGSPILVGTTQGTYKVEPILTQTLFGEPTFRTPSLFPTAPLNQWSFSAARGDLHFIDETGLRSLNLLASSGVVSKDDALSATIYTLFENVQQAATACTFFDNYTMFAVTTIYGYGVVLYDNLRGVFEAIDIFPELTSPIKMFCQTNIQGIKTLYFNTSEEFYQYYGSTETADWTFYTKEFSSDDPLDHFKIIRFRVVLQDILENGTLTATAICDRKKEAPLSVTLSKNLDTVAYPIDFPYGSGTTDTTVNHSFVPQSSKQSDKIGYLVSGNFNCEITSLHLHTERKEAKTPMEQSARAYRK